MSEQLSPKAIIAESIIENFEAVSSYVARQSLRDMLDENQALRAENQRLVLANQELERRLEKILLSRERLERELRGYPPVDTEGVPMVRNHDQEPWRKREPLQPERGRND